MNNCSNPHQFPQNNNRQACMPMQQTCAPKRPCAPMGNCTPAHQVCAPMRNCAPVNQNCAPVHNCAPVNQNRAPVHNCAPVNQNCAPVHNCAPANQDCAPVRQSCSPSQPNHTREQLLCYINEVSFAVTDMNLYLDTHPCDEKALEFCKKHVRMRNEALREYAKCYGPLTIDTTDDVKCNSWEWVSQPWPWEGSVC